MNKVKSNCWICGAGDTSGEHIPKSATLGDVFGEVSQAKPLFHSSKKRLNRQLQSINSTHVKFRVLCSACNTGLTQPYDLAWDQLWHYLSSNELTLTTGMWIHRSRVFPKKSAVKMIDLHLYAVKLMGCISALYGLKIDMRGLANAIKQRKPYPWVFLGVGKRTWLTKVKLAGPSDLNVVHDKVTGECVFAVFFLAIAGWEFQFIYAAPGQLRAGMRNCWNPVSTRFTRRLKMKMFETE